MSTEDAVVAGILLGIFILAVYVFIIHPYIVENKPGKTDDDVVKQNWNGLEELMDKHNKEAEQDSEITATATVPDGSKFPNPSVSGPYDVLVNNDRNKIVRVVGSKKQPIINRKDGVMDKFYSKSLADHINDTNGKLSKIARKQPVLNRQIINGKAGIQVQRTVKFTRKSSNTKRKYYARLTKAQQREVKALYKTGKYTQKRIANMRKFKTNQQTISRILRNIY